MATTGIGLKAGRPSDKQAPTQLSDLKGETIRLNVDIDRALHKRLKLRAVEKDTTIADLVRDMIEEALKR